MREKVVLKVVKYSWIKCYETQTEVRGVRERMEERKRGRSMKGTWGRGGRIYGWDGEGEGRMKSLFVHEGW